MSRELWMWICLQLALLLLRLRANGTSYNGKWRKILINSNKNIRNSFVMRQECVLCKPLHVVMGDCLKKKGIDLCVGDKNSVPGNQVILSCS